MRKSPNACAPDPLHTVVHAIGLHKMFAPGDAVLVGVSGGPDSVALVHILVQVAAHFSISLGIAHLNHSLRGSESERDARFVANLAENLKLPCYIGRKDVEHCRRTWKLSLEEAGRRARYEFFEQTAGRHRFDKIATGHHADDNAELVLMALLRGSGAKGLAGIPPVRDGRYVRPLIDLDRGQILDFLSTNRIVYVTDSSNADPRYLRNRIRHHLIPILQNSYNPNISRTLNRMADIFRAEESWLESIVGELFERCLLTRDGSRIVLSVPELSKMAVAARRRMIREAVFHIKGNLRRISHAHIDHLSGPFLEEAGNLFRTAHLPGRIRIVRRGPELSIIREKRPLRQAKPPPAALTFHYEIADPRLSSNHTHDTDLWIESIGRRLRFSVISKDAAGDWTKTPPDTAFFDMTQLCFPLVARNVKEGDRFTPLGLGGTQTLKTFFINNKISAPARRRSAVLVNGDDIIWVVGHRISDSAKVTAASKNLLRVQLLLA